jgi:hypothetical protein
MSQETGVMSQEKWSIGVMGYSNSAIPATPEF